MARALVPPSITPALLDGVSFDPDQQVQQAVRLVFHTYRRTGSACSTVKHFSEQGLLFPHRVRPGAAKGELRWAAPV